MSQVPPSHEPQPTSPTKSGGALRIVLFAIMFVMLGLLAWDIYARNATHRSFVSIENWVNHELQEHTPADVQQLVGRRPDRPLEDKKDYALETYSWPRGILLKSYFVTVIYRKEGDKVLLHEVVKNTAPEATDLPNPPAAVPPTTVPPTANDDGGETPPATSPETPPVDVPAEGDAEETDEEAGENSTAESTATE